MNLVDQKIKIYRYFDIFIDLMLVLISCRLAIIAERTLLHEKDWHGLSAESLNFQAIPYILFIWILLFFIVDGKEFVYRTSSYTLLFKNIFIISFLAMICTISVDFLLKTNFFYRSSIIFLSLIAFTLLALKRLAVKLFLHKNNNFAIDSKNIMIIGSHKRARHLIEKFSKHIEYGFNIKYIVDPDDNRIGKHINGYTVNENFSNIYDIIKHDGIDEVFIAMPLDFIPNVRKLFNILNALGKSYHILIKTKFEEIDKNDIRLEPVVEKYYGLPMLTFNSLNTNLYSLYIKNIIENFFAIILFATTAPIILFFIVLIKITSKGPAIFKQERIGMHGRKFIQYKLRTMCEDAESKKYKLSEVNEQSGPVFKIKNDPRVTFVGKIIRKFSIDELPQLFNVIIGDMNLIGPRPLPVQEVDNIKKINHHRRHSMKPGITGLWQVSGRNGIKDFDDWVKLDLEYIDNWSLYLDLKIALKTIYVVISGSGS